MDAAKEPVTWVHRSDGSLFSVRYSEGNPRPESTLPSAHGFHIQPQGEKRLVILFPGLNQAVRSGGPNTILRFAAEAAARGIRVLCLSLQTPAMAKEEFQAHLVEELRVDPAVAARMEAHEATGTFWLNRGDRIMATASWTFPLAKILAGRCGLAEPAYFIQDLEPLFLGLGQGHAWLMETYHERFLPIINSPSLAQALFHVGCDSFATPEFRQKALVFTPSVERGRFFPAPPRSGKNILFVYTRLGEYESRNMPELGLEAINRMAWEGLLDQDMWEVHCYGAPDAPPILLKNGMLTRMLPALSMREYAEELRGASLGLSFVLSPHPGYMVFELAACGVPVITNTYLTKTAARMRSLSPLIHAVRPTFDAVTTTLRRLLQEKDHRTPEMAATAPELHLPLTWRESFAPLLPRFMDWFWRGEAHG